MAKLTKAQQAAQDAANKKISDLEKLLQTPSTSGNAQILMPSAVQMTNMLKATNKKITSDQIATIVSKYAGKPLIDTVTGGIPTSGSGLVEAVAALPKELQPSISSQIGLTNAGFGKTLKARAENLLPTLQGAGSIMAFDPNSVAALKAATAALATANDALASGDRAARLGASVSAMYGAISSADNTLTTWGIDTPEMTRLVDKLATNPQGQMTNPNEILDQIRQTQTYKNAFPGLSDINTSPDKAQHMTESQYMSYSEQIRNSATQYGAPMPTQSEIGQLLKGNVSPVEYQQRVTDIFNAVSNADQNTKNILAKEYGINTSDLFSYYANPKNALPTMQRQVAGAQIQDYATRVGLKGIDQTGVSQLADMAKLAATQGNQQLGYGVGQIQNALLNASRDVGLTKVNPGAAPATISTNQLIGSQLAGFAGTNQIAEQVQVARAEQAAAAPFEKGGGYVETAKGITGLGSART